MTNPPPEHAHGQETDPPDVRLAIGATIALLRDLSGRRRIGKDERLRLDALLAALLRLRAHLGINDDGR